MSAAQDAAPRGRIDADARNAGIVDRTAAAEIAHRNLLAVQAAERRPQAHELRRGTGEAPEAWHGAAS